MTKSKLLDVKTFLLSTLLIFIATTSFGQAYWQINFESSGYLNRIVKDTISNPNCSWQIGQPHKTAFTAAFSAPNAIMTDTLHPVRANDTSIFYLKHVRPNNIPIHEFILHFWYQMEGDSTDFGTIELSPDSGHTWVNLLTQDTTFHMRWMSSHKPTMKGTTSGWQHFALDMMDWASSYGTFPVYMTADTILFRFTYISDSNATAHDGWIIDDITLEDWYEGVEEVRNDNLISISPIPTNKILNIHQKKSTNKASIKIINLDGRVLYNDSNFVGESIDIRPLPNGIYLLRYSDTKDYAMKRFVVHH